MLKKTMLLTICIILFLTAQTYAVEIPGYYGGIQNEVQYQEVIFITGEPIIITGTVTITKTATQERYIFRNLGNPEKGVTVTRNITYDIKTNSNGRDQKIQTYSLRSFSETITFKEKGLAFQLTQANNQWSKSKIFHELPGATYFKGSWDGRKLYTINKNQGTVEIVTEGNSYGYTHQWGKTETQTLRHSIAFDRRINGDQNTNINWQGTFEITTSHNTTTNYGFEQNIPNQSSFRGAYMLVEEQENILKYNYNLPHMLEDGTLTAYRNIGGDSLSLKTSPKNRKLFIPSMRDIQGHYAEEDIMFLASLEAFTPNATYFGPSLTMNRGDFARAVATILRLTQEQTTTKQRTVQTQQPKTMFADVDLNNPNRAFIEAVAEKGIMNGSGSIFRPNESLTKAQAVTVLIRALGFENLAPIQQYSTAFLDDAEIPSWARDAVYVAREIGLIEGNNGYFQPNRPLTKAQAARMLMNYINYLREDLRFDYRERILNYSF